MEENIINDETTKTINDVPIITTRPDNPIINWIRSRVFNNDLNALIAVYGARGVGKSCSSIYLSHLIDPTFNLNTMKDRIVNTSQQFMRLMNDENLPKRGACIIWDDAGAGGISSREFMTKNNRAINYVIQTFREKHLVLFMTTPNFKFLDNSVRAMFDAVFEVGYRNAATNEVRAKFKLIDTNARSGKVYYKYIIKDKMRFYQNFKIPKLPLVIVKEYKQIRKRFTDDLNKDSLSKIDDIINKTEKPKPVDTRVRCPECNSTRITMARYGSKCLKCGRKYATYPPIKDKYANMKTSKDEMNDILNGII